VTHLSVLASTGDSWIEVRRGSQTGRILFAGVLTQDEKRRFAAPRLWARFGAAAHLAITVDGRPLVLNGTIEHLFRPTRDATSSG
jgi:hypothetical protein